jgi:hypothetical protein
LSAIEDGEEEQVQGIEGVCAACGLLPDPTDVKPVGPAESDPYGASGLL